MAPHCTSAERILEQQLEKELDKNRLGKNKEGKDLKGPLNGGRDSATAWWYPKEICDQSSRGSHGLLRPEEGGCSHKVASVELEASFVWLGPQKHPGSPVFARGSSTKVHGSVAKISVSYIFPSDKPGQWEFGFLGQEGSQPLDVSIGAPRKAVGGWGPSFPALTAGNNKKAEILPLDLI